MLNRAFRPAILQTQILSLDLTELMEPLPYSLARRKRRGCKNTNDRYPSGWRWLSDERQRVKDRRATEQRDELAASNDGHWGSLPRMPPPIISGRNRQTQAV